MKLKLKIQRDGSLRPRWYGAWVTDGRYHETSLCRWRGKPPASYRVRDEGDKAFEDSRTRALAELREIVEGERSKSDRDALAARVHRARYGQKVRRVKIAIASAGRPSSVRIRPFMKRPCASFGLDAMY